MKQEAIIKSQKSSSTERHAWRVGEYCDAFRISHSTFWKFVGLGKIKIIRIGDRVLIPHEEAKRIASEGVQ
jgi:hypothetical protein